jgi:hypothetical protein
MWQLPRHTARVAASDPNRGNPLVYVSASLQPSGEYHTVGRSQRSLALERIRQWQPYLLPDYAEKERSAHCPTAIGGWRRLAQQVLV